MFDRLLYTSLKFVKGNGGAVGLAGKEGGMQPPEVFLKKLFLEISQNSKENPCATVSF